MDWELDEHWRRWRRRGRTVQVGELGQDRRVRIVWVVVRNDDDVLIGIEEGVLGIIARRLTRASSRLLEAG